MGEVYQAEDLQNSNASIALKILNNEKISRRTEDLIRFRAEATIASTIDHPNVVKIFESGTVAVNGIPTHFIAMEYLDGTNLMDMIAPDRALPVKEALDIAIQLCGALEATHEKKIIHGDIKPDNVIICGQKTVLIDYGLARIKELDRGNAVSAAGSLYYIAPEQIRVTRGRTDERSDLYSLGILLYRLITGRLPFEAADINTVIHQHIAVKPALPSHFNKNLPPSLDAVVMKLLEKEPENRYQSAHGLEADLRKICAGAADFIPGGEDRHIRLTFKTKMVGREKELSILKNYFSGARKNRGALLVLNGESGLGKTRLMEEFRRHVISEKGVTIAAKCFQGYAKMPYGAIHEAMGDYYSFFISLPADTRKKISSVVSEHIGELGEIIIKINPLMKEIVGSCPPLVELKSNRESRRFHMVAATFLASLARASSPMALFLDDIQWLDNGSIDVLNELIPLLPQTPLVVVASFRKDAADINPSAEKIAALAKESGGILEISPLNFNHMRELIAGMLPFGPSELDEVTSFVLRTSKGNPFHAIEILKHLERSGVIDRNEGWNLRSDTLNTAEIPDSVIESVIKRIALFDEREALVLSFAAVLGKNFDTSLLYHIASRVEKTQGYPEAEIIWIVDKAKELLILEDNPRGPKNLQFVHDRIQEALYSRIPPEERKALHGIIARTLEEKIAETGQPEDLLFDLAHHSVLGGESEKIVRYAFPAAIKAKEKYANEVAIRYFSNILECIENRSIPLEQCDLRRMQILVIENLGEVYHTIGEYDRAIELFNSILGLIENTGEKARIYQQISRSYFKKGDWLNCERHGKKGLSLLGEKLPTREFAVAISIIREILSGIIQPLVTPLFRKKRKRKERDERIIWIYLDLGWSYILSDILKYVRTALRTKNIAQRRIGPSSHLAMAHAIMGSLWMSIGRFKKSEQCFEKSLKLYNIFTDQWGRGQTLQWLAYSQEWKGDFGKSLQYFIESYNIFRSIGDVREMGMCVAGKIHNYTYTSDYPNAAKALDEYLDISNKTGDDYGISESWTYRSRYYLEIGEPSKAEECALKAFNHSLEKNVLFTHCRASIELGSCLLEMKEVSRALHYLQHAKDLFESGNFLRHYTIHLFYHLADAMLNSVLNGLPDGTCIPAQQLKEIKKTVSRALRESARWRTHRPGALRSAAHLYEAEGKIAKAERLFAASIEEAQKIGRRYEEALSMVEYSSLLMRHGKEKKAIQLLNSALAVSSQIGAEGIIKKIVSLLGLERESTASLGPISRSLGQEKLSAAIRLCDEIATGKDPETVLERIMLASLQIAGAQRAFLFQIDAESGLPVLRASKDIPGGCLPEFSRTIVDEVIATGRRIIISNAGEDSLFRGHKSVLLGELKSVMCIPVWLSDRLAGVYYLDNPLSTGVFSENEAKILEALLSRAADCFRTVFKSVSASATASSVPPQEEKISSILKHIEENYALDISRESLAEEFNLNPDYLGKIFKSATGKKIGEYINELRIKNAAEKLSSTDALIIDIAYSTGFESLRTFNRAFKKETGISPMEYRERFSQKK